MRTTLIKGTDALEGAADMLARALATLAGVAVACLVASVVYDVASRSLGRPGLRGLVEYGETLMVAVVFLSIGYAQMSGHHIRIDLVVERLPCTLARIVDGLVLVVLAVFLLWAASETATAALDSMRRGEIRFGLVSVPVWPARSLIPLGFLSMALQCLVQGGRSLLVDPRPSATADTAVVPTTTGGA